jgi:hypothetical protein
MEQRQMKSNLKVIIALALIVVVIFWAVDSVRQRSYSGDNLSFAVGNGPVTVMNPSDEAITVQLVSPETRAFAVSTAIEGAAGTSAREGTGREAVHLWEFELPSGVSEFTITRGKNVTFTAIPSTDLEATVQPVNAGDARNTLIAAVAAVVALLYYVYRTTGFGLMGMMRRQVASDLAAKKLEEKAAFKRILDRTKAD